MRVGLLCLVAINLCAANQGQGHSGDKSQPNAQVELGEVEVSAAESSYLKTQHQKQTWNSDVLAELSSLLHSLQSTWYQLWLGTWPTSIDWTGAVLNTHLMATIATLSRAGLQVANQSAYQLTENDINGYFAHSAAYYFGEDAAALRQEAYDDMLWVVLSWLESIKFVEAHSERYHEGTWYGKQHIELFAHRARVFYNITTAGWSTDLCGGGMIWNPQFEPYKNAVTNQLYIAASIGMYIHFPGDAIESSVTQTGYKKHDKRFLDAALRSYSWLRTSNMTNTDGLFVDGFHISNLYGNHTNSTQNMRCDDRNEMVYTYNQGIILSAAYELFRATGNSTYLQDGYTLVNATMAATGWHHNLDRPSNTSAWQGLGRNGIIEEFCDSTGSCDQNAHIFKSIYFHHLATFCDIDGFQELHELPELDVLTVARHKKSCRSYIAWVRHNSQAALSTKDSHGRIGTWWGAADPQASKHRIDDTKEMPLGAIDYRNDRRALRRLQGHRARRTGLKHHSGKRHAAKAQTLLDGKQARPDGDLNDRGRGRTVESHVGGLAVVRCLWQLEHLSA